MENLISLIIDLLSALFSGSKKEKKDEPQQSRPDPSRPRPQPASTSWESELRRLLDNQGQQSATPPPRPIRPAAPPPMPRVVSVPRPVPVLIETPAARAPSARVRPMIVPPPLPPAFQPANQPLANLTESQLAYARASQLDKSAATRIERVPGEAVQSTQVARRPVSAEVAQVLSLFKNPQAARQAFVASTIFGAPRAFEEQTTPNF